MFSLRPGTSEAVEERRGGGHTDMGTQHLTCQLGEGVCLEHRGSRNSSPQTLRNTAHCCLDGIAEHIFCARADPRFVHPASWMGLS